MSAHHLDPDPRPSLVIGELWAAMTDEAGDRVSLDNLDTAERLSIAIPARSLRRGLAPRRRRGRRRLPHLALARAVERTGDEMTVGERLDQLRIPRQLGVLERGRTT